MSANAFHCDPQTDWWTQPFDNLIGHVDNQRCGSISIAGCDFPVRQQDDSALWAPTGFNDAFQETQGMSNYWFNSSSSFIEPSYAFQHAQPSSGQLAGQYMTSASLPPAAFTKQPLAIDQCPNSTFSKFDVDSPLSCYSTNSQVLPASDVPALEYDSKSADQIVQYGRDWTQSPLTQGVDSMHSSTEGDENLENSDPCYAELLRQALMERDDRTMLLKELYEWVRTHSSKAQDPSNRGWQNSVRHNLSMNAVSITNVEAPPSTDRIQAFERVPPPNQESGTRKTSYWRLTQQAAEFGISSTTRYRKDGKRKTQRNPNPAPIRVQAGAKGGQATRRSVRRQQKAASPLNNLGPPSSARQQHDCRPHYFRHFSSDHVQQQSNSRHSNAPYLEHSAGMIAPLSNMLPTNGNSTNTGDFLAPFTSVQPAFDWSVSSSPMEHQGHDIGGWRFDQNTFGV